MTERLHPDDMDLILGAIFHAPRSGTFPPMLSTVASSMAHGIMFRQAAEGVSSPQPVLAAKKTDIHYHLDPKDLPSKVGEGGVLNVHVPSVVARLGMASSFEEQVALLDALVLFGTQKARANFGPWLNHAAACPALTGMLCTCGLDEVGL